MLENQLKIHFQQFQTGNHRVGSEEAGAEA
jgi:hypothetical protein